MLDPTVPKLVLVIYMNMSYVLFFYIFFLIFLAAGIVDENDSRLHM